MKKILILGAGFLGKAILERLITKRNYVCTVVNKNKPYKQFEGVEYIECDISNIDEINIALFNRKFDCVINSLGYVSHGLPNLEHLRKGGYDKLIGIINIFRSVSFNKIINFGTGMEVAEGDDGYQLVNRAVTSLLKNIDDEKIKAVSIIVPHIIGGHQKAPRLIPYILESIKKDNEIIFNEDVKKNYIYIHDFVELVLKVLEDEGAPSVIYAEGIINASPREILKEIEGILGIKAKISIANSDKTYSIFPSLNYTKWAPKLNLKSAVVNAIKEHLDGHTYAIENEFGKNQLIRLSKSKISWEERASVAKVLKNEYLGMGGMVYDFERAISALVGSQACCVVNGTSALHLALLACGIGEGDEVIVPSYTYLATYQAISAVGATPVHCEINPKTGTIDIDNMRLKISSKTKAILPVHYIGSCEGIEVILEIAAKLKIRVIEDAAHSFGGEDSRGIIGGHGDIICFSFDGIKNITSGEGGAVVTKDQDVLRFVSDARLLGVQGDSKYRYLNKRVLRDIKVSCQGWRYHMSNIMAAIGIEQIKKIEDIALVRRRIAKFYIEKLSNHEKIQFLEKDYCKIIPHAFAILVDGVDKNELIREAGLNNIELGYGYFPNHHLEYYSNGEKLPITEDFYSRLIALPIHLDITEGDQTRVCDYLLNYLRRIM